MPYIHHEKKNKKNTSYQTTYFIPHTLFPGFVERKPWRVGWRGRGRGHEVGEEWEYWKIYRQKESYMVL